MDRNFEDWLKIKFDIHQNKPRIHCRQGEIWFCSFGFNVGSEQNGKGVKFLRPVIVFKLFNNRIFWAIPLSRTIKPGKYYFNFQFDYKPSSAILSQMRLLDIKRLRYKIAKMNNTELGSLKAKLKRLLE